MIWESWSGGGAGEGEGVLERRRRFSDRLSEGGADGRAIADV